MRKRFQKPPEFVGSVQISHAAAEGMCIARHDQKVVFVPFAAPGDIVDLQIIKRKKSYFEGKILQLHQASEFRIEPICSHFGLCGGCKWQHMIYNEQLRLKQQQVTDNFDRIGKFDYPGVLPIKGSSRQFYYRNKLEYTFSDRKWLTINPKLEEPTTDMRGLGFHLPGMFDRILDIEQCHLQDEPSNAIRLKVKEFAINNNLSFYNVKNHQGLLRNLIIRNTRDGSIMIILVISTFDERITNDLLPMLADSFPAVTSIFYVINPKKNDQIHELDLHCFKGELYLTETMAAPVAGQPDLQFRIGPVSFFQTNPTQAELLYKTAFDFAGFKGDELVFDLYTGTGTIAAYIANSVKKVIGIEYVVEAVKDAGINSALNGLNNTVFISGDMAKVLHDALIVEYGKPDVIITDPPRAGMHPKVIEQLLNIAAPKIVYVSCNPATQARDIALLSEKYAVKAVQPVDMFPQTHHVENVVLLEIKP